MRIPFRLLAAGLLAACLSSPAAARDKTAAAPTCGEYGTSVHFEKSPSAAAKRAQDEEKLVFVLHISGHFEEPDFT
jgi:hypothetical protein